MSQATYEEVIKLADQLTPEEKQALVIHLQEQTTPRNPNARNWRSLLDAVKVSVPPGPAFSDRRADWYDDDGR